MPPSSPPGEDGYKPTRGEQPRRRRSARRPPPLGRLCASWRRLSLDLPDADDQRSSAGAGGQYRLGPGGSSHRKCAQHRRGHLQGRQRRWVPSGRHGGWPRCRTARCAISPKLERLLRAHPATARSDIVRLDEHVAQQHRMECPDLGRLSSLALGAAVLERGAIAFLPKPLTVRELRAALLEVLNS